MVSQYEKNKMVAQAQILGRTSGAGPGPSEETDNFNKSDIPLLVGGVGGSILVLMFLYYLHRQGARPSSVRNLDILNRIRRFIIAA